jgi:hypothetical protein
MLNAGPCRIVRGSVVIAVFRVILFGMIRPSCTIGIVRVLLNVSKRGAIKGTLFSCPGRNWRMRL